MSSSKTGAQEHQRKNRPETASHVDLQLGQQGQQRFEHHAHGAHHHEGPQQQRRIEPPCRETGPAPAPAAHATVIEESSERHGHRNEVERGDQPAQSRRLHRVVVRPVSGEEREQQTEKSHERLRAQRDAQHGEQVARRGKPPPDGALLPRSARCGIPVLSGGGLFSPSGSGRPRLRKDMRLPCGGSAALSGDGLRTVFPARPAGRGGLLRRVSGMRSGRFGSILFHKRFRLLLFATSKIVQERRNAKFICVPPSYFPPA